MFDILPKNRDERLHITDDSTGAWLVTLSIALFDSLMWLIIEFQWSASRPYRNSQPSVESLAMIGLVSSDRTSAARRKYLHDYWSKNSSQSSQSRFVHHAQPRYVLLFQRWYFHNCSTTCSSIPFVMTHRRILSGEALAQVDEYR